MIRIAKLSPIAALVAICTIPLTAQGGPQAEVRVVANTSVEKADGLYTFNRPPLMPSRFLKLPVGSITPRGWLRGQLELEAQGMAGRLTEVSPFLKWEGNGWVDPKGRAGWEEVSYWLKGYGDLGYVLRDEKIIAGARRWIEGILAAQQADGWFGPDSLRTAFGGKPDMWPHMPVLNALQSYYEFSGDKRVIEFMLRYARWQNALPAGCFGEGYWPKMRFGDNLESVYWLYNQTGEPWLLDLGKKIHEHMADWTTGVHNWHNVNIAECFREPAEYWLQAKDTRFLEATERGYRQVMDMYGQFPGGGFAGDENCRPGYVDPRQGFETCGIVEFMHSFEMLTRISGNPLWADRCEEIALNSMPASMTPDLKALHYLTGANMVQCDRKNKSPGLQNGGTMLSYSPTAVYRCCQHNHGMGWPYYAEELWLATADRGLCASLYAASEVTAKVGDAVEIKITEETEYPFDETIALAVSTPRPVRFPLYLRVPRWTAAPTVKLNNEDMPVKADPLSFIVIDRTWSAGDRVVLRLPRHVSVRKWAKNKDSVSVDYGPLTFSLKIGERWVRYGGTAKWPEQEIFPTTPWNYGLVLDPKEPARSLEVVRKSGPSGPSPFTPETVPLEIHARAKKIPAWQQDRLGLIGLLQQSPAKSDEPEETVTLIPMGAARLRVASFPTIGSGPDAHQWIAPAVPVPSAYKPSASHVYELDTVDALCDGVEPASSSDHAIPRFTWWNHCGTKEWIQYEFAKPKTCGGVAVYWFDDRGHGGCRVPDSWRIVYKDGEAWKPVEAAGPYGTRPNGYNSVKFKPVSTGALRIEVQLQPSFSGGVLEWKVE